MRPLLDLLYPSRCLYCDEPCECSKRLFCHPCSQLMTLAELQARCRGCFSDEEDLHCGLCRACRKQPNAMVGCAAALDNWGVAASLAYALHQNPTPLLLGTAAALIVAQHERLNWPYPDLVMVPRRSRVRRLLLGGDPAFALGKEVAAMLGRPLVSLEIERWSPSGPVCHKANTPSPLVGKVVLLVDDTLRTGRTLRIMASSLVDAHPSSIQGVVLVRQNNAKMHQPPRHYS